MTPHPPPKEKKNRCCNFFLHVSCSLCRAKYLFFSMYLKRNRHLYRQLNFIFIFICCVNVGKIHGVSAEWTIKFKQMCMRVRHVWKAGDKVWPLLGGSVVPSLSLTTSGQRIPVWVTMTGLWQQQTQWQGYIAYPPATSPQSDPSKCAPLPGSYLHSTSLCNKSSIMQYS